MFHLCWAIIREVQLKELYMVCVCVCVCVYIEPLNYKVVIYLYIYPNKCILLDSNKW